MTTSSPAILALDQGTHASRALLFSAAGELLDAAVRPVGLVDFGDGRVEQDGGELLASLQAAMDEVVAGFSGQIEAAGLVTQRSTLVAWDRINGKPLAPAIGWQDRRAVSVLAGYGAQEQRIKAITGLPLSPHYLAGKMRWLLENNEPVRQAAEGGRLCMGPLASFLLFHLLPDRPFIVDAVNAGRSLLLDLERRDWSEELLSLFAIERQWLPEVRPCEGDYGRLGGTSIPLRAVSGDQNGALFAGGAPDSRRIVVNIGSGAFALRATGRRPIASEGMLSALASSDGEGGDYLLEGTVNGAGIAFARCFAEPEKILAGLDAALSATACPPLFLNGVGGLGSPWWRELKSRFIPEPEGEAERASAVAESILFPLAENIERLRHLPGLPDVDAIRIGGGLAQSGCLCQRLADLTALPLERAPQFEASGRGIAFLAAGRPLSWVGLQPDSAQSSIGAKDVGLKPDPQIFWPQPDRALRCRFRRFRRALLANESPPPRVVGHRGYLADFPENTLASLSAAIGEGADGVEFDIQISRDGVPMLHHDASLLRTGTTDERLFDLTAGELSRRGVGEPQRFGDLFADERMATLDRALTLLAAHPEVRLFVEIKRESLDQFGLERALDPLLAELAGWEQRAVLISFEYEALAYAAINSELPLGWVIRDIEPATLVAARELMPEYLIVNHKRLPAASLPVGPWRWMLYEINDVATAELWLSRGATSIETAEVALLASELGGQHE